MQESWILTSVMQYSCGKLRLDSRLPSTKLQFELLELRHILLDEVEDGLREIWCDREDEEVDEDEEAEELLGEVMEREDAAAAAAG